MLLGQINLQVFYMGNDKEVLIISRHSWHEVVCTRIVPQEWRALWSSGRRGLMWHPGSSGPAPTGTDVHQLAPADVRPCSNTNRPIVCIHWQRNSSFFPNPCHLFQKDSASGKDDRDLRRGRRRRWGENHQDFQDASSAWLASAEESQINAQTSPANSPYRTGFWLGRVLPWLQQHRMNSVWMPTSHNLSPTPTFTTPPPASKLFSCPLLLSMFVFLSMISIWPGHVQVAHAVIHSVIFHLSTSLMFSFLFDPSCPFVSWIFLV